MSASTLNADPPQVIKMNVNKNTRAGKNGKCLACPKCGHKSIVYHFAWCASTCGWNSGGCHEMIEKNDWVVIG